MNITFVSATDWVGMYVDDKLVVEGRSIDHGELLKTLRTIGALKDGTNIWTMNAGDLVFQIYDNRLPKTIQEIKNCNAGVYHRVYENVVDIYKDGYLVQTIKRSVYDMIIGADIVKVLTDEK